MNRKHSKVEDLPREKQSELDRLLIEGSTYEEIAGHFKKHGHELSRSGIGRYGKGFLEEVRRLRIIEDQSKTLVSEAGDGLVLDEAGGKLMARRIIELLMEKDIPLKSVPGLAVGLSAIISANVKREKFKSDMTKKIDKAVDAVTAIVKKNGLSESAAGQIRNKILGIK